MNDLLEHLQSGDPTRCAKALFWLLDGDAAVWTPPLYRAVARLLTAKDEVVSAAARLALARADYAPSEVPPEVLAFLSSPGVTGKADVLRAALRGELSPELLALLPRLLRDGCERTRIVAAGALWRRSENVREVTDCVLAALSSTDDHNVLLACHVAGELRHQADVLSPLLERLVSERPGRARGNALSALRELGHDPEALLRLCELCDQDAEPLVRFVVSQIRKAWPPAGKATPSRTAATPAP
jgi:hypothetical protein